MTAFPILAPFSAAATALVTLAAALAISGGSDVRLWHAVACDTTQRLHAGHGPDPVRPACGADAPAADGRSAIGVAQ